MNDVSVLFFFFFFFFNDTATTEIYTLSLHDALPISTEPDDATLAKAPEAKGRIAIVGVAGASASNGPTLLESMPMPGPVTRVAYDDATQMVHVLGRTPDATAATVYVIE